MEIKIKKEKIGRKKSITHLQHLGETPSTFSVRCLLDIRRFRYPGVGGILFVMSIDQSDPVELPVGAKKHEKMDKLL